MKILFVLEYFYPYHGGAEKLFYQLTKDLCKRGIEVTVLTADYDNLPNEETIDSIRIKRIKAHNRFQFSFLGITKAIELAKDFDLIHSTTYNAALPAWMASKVRSKPIVLTVHEYWNELWWQLPFLNPVQRLSFWSFEQLVLSLNYNQVVAVSDYTRQRLPKRIGEKSRNTIYNGQPVMQSNHSRGLGDFYLFVGRLGVSKGIDILVEGINLACQTNAAFQFKLVVPKTPRHILKFITSKLNSLIHSKNVEILHSIDDAQLLYLMQIAKAIIIPSYSEGFGFVASEATALGTPIIHSGRGALDEVAGGRVNKLHEYSGKGLCKAILQAENNYFDTVNSKQYPIEITSKEYIKLYQRLITSSR